MSEKNQVDRREFLNSMAAGAAILAAGPIFNISGKEGTMGKMPDIYICGVCGHIEFGTIPQNCPVCHAPKEKFSQNNSIFDDTLAKYADVVAKHVPIIMVEAKPNLIPDVPTKEISVRIGKIMHPVEEAHHIRFIDVYLDNKFVSRFPLTLKVYPAVSIYLKEMGSAVRIVELCTLHGYWQMEMALK